MNQFNIEYAFPGLCSLCHVEIAEFNGSNKYGTPNIVKLKSNYREGVVRLDDGSNMRVTLCNECEDFTPKQAGKLMESEIEGWRHSTNKTDWDSKKKNEHNEKYAKRFISTRLDKVWSISDGIPTKPKEKNNGNRK